jgi:very-short-patch-repair endonuclease
MGVNIEWWQHMQREADEDDLRTGDFGFIQMSVSPDTYAIESPIEYRLYAWLKTLADKYGYKVKPQWEFGQFRYDFGITDKNGELLALIECDGAEFHCTPEQLERDKQKTAAAEMAAIRLFRWTGKEIYRDAQRCAEAIFFLIWPAGQ